MVVLRLGTVIGGMVTGPFKRALDGKGYPIADPPRAAAEDLGGLNMRKHKKLIEAALAAIEEVFSDTSVDVLQTRESLEELIDDIRMKLSTLKNA
jgi:hypothetical protein